MPERLINHNPQIPATSVTINCAMLLTIVNAALISRFPSSTYKTLPTYSPILLGVKKAMVVPENTALREVTNEIFVTPTSASCHLRASIPQFTNISANTNTSFHTAVE